MNAICYAREDDATAVVDLINLAYVVESHFVSGPRIEEAAVSKRIAASEVLILREGGQLVATAHVHVDGDCGHLGLVSVHPDQQGKGLGRRIIDAAETAAMKNGADRMHLQVVNLRTELPDFYRRLGYVERGTSTFDDTKATLKPVHFIDMAKSLL